MTTTTTIRIAYESCDGFRRTRRFKTAAGAAAYATQQLGKNVSPCGPRSAVSFDGIGKLYLDGITVAEIWPHCAADANY